MLTLKRLKEEGFEIIISKKGRKEVIKVISKKFDLNPIKIVNFPFQILDKKGKIFMRGENWETAKMIDNLYVIKHGNNTPSDICVHNSLRFILANELPGRNGLLIHSSSALYKGTALCFAGKSGSGKTTIINLLKRMSPLHDDMNIIIHNEEILLYPFPQKYGNVKGFPLKHLFILKKGKMDRVKKIPHEFAIADILSCVPFIHTSTTLMKKAIKVLENILEKVNVYELYFTLNGDWEEKILSLIDD